MLHICRWLEQISWIVTLNSSEDLSSVIWLAHFFGFFILVGATALVDLRVLGVAARKQKLTPLAEQLLPWAWAGLALVIASGFIMFAGEAPMLYPTTAFRVKMIVVLLAIVFGIVVQKKIPAWDAAASLPVGARWLALISLALWIGAILASLEVPAFNPV